MKAKVLEVEKKFYCPKNADEIVKRIERLGYVFAGDSVEQDTYFTDLEGQYVRDRTCLRIRAVESQTGKSFEFTFKPKSAGLGSGYAKIEENVALGSEEEKYMKIRELNKKGFFVYVDFKKQRRTYSKQKDGLVFNILLDQLIGVGNFLEFEILAPVDESSDLEEILSNVINEFSECGLSEADKPYRDFVAQYWNNRLLLQSSTITLPSSAISQIDPRISGLCAGKNINLHFNDSVHSVDGPSLTHFYDVNQLLLIAMYAR